MITKIAFTLFTLWALAALAVFTFDNGARQQCLAQHSADTCYASLN